MNVRPVSIFPRKRSTTAVDEVEISNMAARGGVKRARREMDSNNTSHGHAPRKNIDENSPVITAFRSYQLELDSKHDKYERLVKYSRDVTIASKRIIFLLHRISGEEDQEKVFEEARKKLDEVRVLLKKIASELVGEDYHRFKRAYSPGIQEFVEALSFFEYLKRSDLLTQEDVMDFMIFKEEDGSVTRLEVTPMDYVLGIADLTGELMRLCINRIGNGDRSTPIEICAFLRRIHDAFTCFDTTRERDMRGKLGVLKNSLNKVESVCYTIQVRGQRFHSTW